MKLAVKQSGSLFVNGGNLHISSPTGLTLIGDHDFELSPVSSDQDQYCILTVFADYLDFNEEPLDHTVSNFHFLSETCCCKFVLKHDITV